MKITLLLLLQTNPDLSNVATESTAINWTAIGVIISAVSIFLILGGMLIKIGRFSEGFKNVVKSVDDMGADIRKNTMTLKSITTHLYSSGNAAHGLFEHNSPITLTDIGKSVLEQSGGKDYIDKHQITLIQEMENENLETALDVQNYSSSLLFLKTEIDGFKYIKDWVYNNPVFENINITMAEIIKVMAVYLRDKYLEKHTNLLEK